MIHCSCGSTCPLVHGAGADAAVYIEAVQRRGHACGAVAGAAVAVGGVVVVNAVTGDAPTAGNCWRQVGAVAGRAVAAAAAQD